MGRGSSKAGGGNKSVIDSTAPMTTVQTEIRNGVYLRTNVEAKAVSGRDGVLELSKPDYTNWEQVSRTTRSAEATMRAGFVNTANGSMNGEWFGINWDNFNEVVGDTYNFRLLLRDMGFEWSRDTKSWKKQKR